MLRCLVLGGTGFLGINLCEALLACGYEVYAFSRGGDKSEYLQQILSKVRIIKADFTLVENWGNFLTNVDIVFHLISTTKPSNENLLYEFSTNVIPTIRLLEACRGRNIKLIYFSSGGTVYGIPKYLPIDECHSTEPISAYGIHKLSVEKCIEYYGRSYGINYIILRIANPYGAYQDFNSGQGIIAIFLEKLKNKKPLEIWGDGENIRDYIYIKDLINACMKVITYKGNKKIFNIGSGKGHTIKEIVQILKKKVSYCVEIKFLPARIQDVSVNVLDISLAKKELNWLPKVTLEAGIDVMVDF